MSNEQKFTAFSFDATQVKPAAPMEPVPADFYTVAIIEAEVKPTADGSGLRMPFVLEILDGPFKGRKIFDGLNIKNNSAQAQEIAHQQLSAICHATGVMQITDVQQFYGKPFTAKIGLDAGSTTPAKTDPITGAVTPAKTYEPKNTFKGAKPVTAPGVAAGAPGAGAPTPPTPSWAGKPAGAPTPPAPAPAAPGAAIPPPFAPKPPAPPAPPPPAPPIMVKKLVMTAKANGMTAEQFRASDPAWTDELLVREGYAEIKEEPATPSAPAAPSAPSAPAAPGGVQPPAWAVKK